MEAWFISDIHLKNQEERNGQILLRFLHSLQAADPQTTQLFMLGDIFDLWVGGHSYFGRKFQPLMDALKALTSKGMKVVYIEGNHDVHVERYFQKKLGVQVFVEAQYYEMNGMMVRLEHGDLINPEDEAYLKYRGIIRNPYIKPLGEIVPGFVWDYFGNRASKKSRAKSSTYRHVNEEKLTTMIRDHGAKVYASEKPFDVIISGHMHVFDDIEIPVGDRRIRSINLGSWLEKSVKVLHLKDQNFNWVEIV